MINDMEMQLRRFGIQDMESYYRQTGQNRDQMRDSLRPEAKRQAERNLLLSELLRVESLTISDEELEKRISDLLANNDPETAQQLAAMFRHESGRAILESQLLREKSVNRLLAVARGKGDEEPAPAPATPDEAAPAEATSEEPTGETTTEAAPAAEGAETGETQA